MSSQSPPVIKHAWGTAVDIIVIVLCHIYQSLLDEMGLLQYAPFKLGKGVFEKCLVGRSYIKGREFRIALVTWSAGKEIMKFYAVMIPGSQILHQIKSP